jgi:hypothetical protein
MVTPYRESRLLPIRRPKPDLHATKNIARRRPLTSDSTRLSCRRAIARQPGAAESHLLRLLVSVASCDPAENRR